MRRATKRAVCWLWQRGLLSFEAGYAVLVLTHATEA